jgi:hypothetical protein
VSWPMSRTVERQARRLVEVMQRLEVDPLRLARERRGEAYAEARLRCLHCSRVEECLRWLRSDSPDGGPPYFCANLRLFESCKR